RGRARGAEAALLAAAAAALPLRAQVGSGDGGRLRPRDLEDRRRDKRGDRLRDAAGPDEALDEAPHRSGVVVAAESRPEPLHVLLERRRVDHEAAALAEEIGEVQRAFLAARIGACPEGD